MIQLLVFPKDQSLAQLPIIYTNVTTFLDTGCGPDECTRQSKIPMHFCLLLYAVTPPYGFSKNSTFSQPDQMMLDPRGTTRGLSQKVCKLDQLFRFSSFMHHSSSPASFLLSYPRVPNKRSGTAIYLYQKIPTSMLYWRPYVRLLHFHFSDFG